MTNRTILSIILILVFCTPALADDQPQPQPADSWKLMLQHNYEEIKYQLDYVEGVSQSLPGMVKQTRQDLASLRKKLDELMMLARVSGSSPMELRAVLAGLDILQARVDAVTMPFQKADTDLKRFQDRVGELETEFARQPDENQQSDAGKAMGDFLGDLRKLRGKLGRVKTVLDQGMGPTRDLQAGIGRLSKTVTDRIPNAWKDYYLSPGKGLLSVGAWQEGVQRLTDLPRIGSMYANLLDSASGQMRDVLVRLVGLALVIVLAAGAGLNRLKRSIPDLPVTQPLAAVCWIAVGAGVLWATSGPSFVLAHAEASAVAEILIARGVLGLSLFLRSCQKGECSTRRSPASGAWWMFAAASLLQIPWIPAVLRGASWVVLLFLAGWLVRRFQTGQVGVVSRLARAGGWLYPVLALPALFGWVNVTLLAAEAWFLLLVFLQAGLALYGLVNRAVERPAHDLAGEVIRCVAGGLALPLTVISMAGGFLFWMSLAMGGRSVFVDMVSSDVGEGDVSLDLTRVAVIFIGFYVARSATRLAERFISELPVRRPDLELGVVNLLETMSGYVVWGIYSLIALRLAGASFTSLAVVAGGLSVGIGFGLQNIINNFISGLILLFGRSVQAGDVLEIGGAWGTVRRVNIRNTVVQTFDNATLFVPNSDLIAQKIVNWSHKDRRVRRILEVGVAYGSDTERVRSLLLQAATDHPHVLVDPAPGVQFVAFGDSSLNFKLLFWVDDLDNGPRTSSDLHLAVDRLFRENGVEIPFPQRDVHLRGASPAQAEEKDFHSGCEEGSGK